MARDHAALHAYLAAAARRPFGGFDEFDCCVRLAAGAVLAQTGDDPLARLAAAWSTPVGAARALKQAGGLVGGVDQVLKRVPLALAHRGDVGAVVAGGQTVLVIVEGAMLVGPDPKGLRRLARCALSVAWSATCA